MARTILQIAQGAAERYATAPAPSKLFGTNDRNARILRQAAYDTIREYLRTHHWVGLSDHHSTWAFSTVPGRYAYPLPPDFLRTIPMTAQREGWPMGLVGPASPESWSHWITGQSAVVAPMGWRIRNGALYIEPTPASAELVTIDYISKFPVVSDIQEADIDISKSPPAIIAPAVFRDGYLAVERGIGTNGTDETGQYDQPPGFDVGKYGESIFEALKRGHPMSEIAPLAQVRRAEFSADADTPAFDDDHFLSLGMTMRLRIGLGLDYSEVGAEYEEEMEIKAATDAGAGAATKAGPYDDCDVLPLGSGRWLVG